MSGDGDRGAHALAAYRAARAEWEAARTRIAEEGILVADEKGRPVPHPAIAVERSAAAEMRAWLPVLERLAPPPEKSDGPRW